MITILIIYYICSGIIAVGYGSKFQQPNSSLIDFLIGFIMIPISILYTLGQVFYNFRQKHN